MLPPVLEVLGVALETSCRRVHAHGGVLRLKAPDEVDGMQRLGKRHWIALWNCVALGCAPSCANSAIDPAGATDVDAVTEDAAKSPIPRGDAAAPDAADPDTGGAASADAQTHADAAAAMDSAAPSTDAANPDASAADAAATGFPGCDDSLPVDLGKASTHTIYSNLAQGSGFGCNAAGSPAIFHIELTQLSHVHLSATIGASPAILGVASACRANELLGCHAGTGMMRVAAAGPRAGEPSARLYVFVDRSAADAAPGSVQVELRAWATPAIDDQGGRIPLMMDGFATIVGLIDPIRSQLEGSCGPAGSEIAIGFRDSWDWNWRVQQFKVLSPTFAPALYVTRRLSEPLDELSCSTATPAPGSTGFVIDAMNVALPQPLPGDPDTHEASYRYLVIDGYSGARPAPFSVNVVP